MKTYTLRIIPEVDEIVYRDIIVNEKNTFYQLHDFILDAFEFSKDQMASFYKSDEDWIKGQEISLFGVEDSDVLEMDSTLIGNHIQDINQKFIYVYDFLAMWNFTIEIMEIGKSAENKNYPINGKSFGKAPNQNEKDLDANDAESILVNALFEDEDKGSYKDLYDEEEEDDLFDDDRFESLDDYDEYQ